MSSTFHGLEVGKRSLFAQQSALHTTGHNIANANTTGYTRQRVELQPTNPLSYPGMSNDRSPLQMGTGVHASEIIRIREEYLDIQFRNEQKGLGYWEAKRDIYSGIEEIINEPSEESLQKLMDQFWQSWQDLAKNPESLAARAVVRERAVAVGDQFRHMMNALNQTETDLTNVVQANVREINSITKQISDLNDQISKLVPHGYQPNDLFDRRDVLIDQLSKLVDVDVRPGANGLIEVWSGGQQLVNGRTSQEIAVDTNTFEVSVDGGVLALTSGSLLATVEGRGRVVNGQMVGIIPSMKQQLNDYAVNFAEQLNQVHQGGTDMNGNAANIRFFVDRNDPASGPKDAASLVVNPLIVTSLNHIATGHSASIGDGSNAQAIASLKSVKFDLNGQSTTFDDFYRNTVAKLGIDSQNAQRMAENSERLVTQIENRRQSVSGVSIDEEMSNIIRFQQAYNAAARFVTTVDEVLDKVINGMGRVGL